MLGRRRFLGIAGFTAVSLPLLYATWVRGQAAESPPSLMSAPLEMAGAWQWRKPALRVLTRVREVCLAGVKLVSDRQPTRIRIDEHRSGSPAIWLHSKLSTTAWIILDVGPSAWCQVSYQFGHELGHVLCNSWQSDAKPAFPCRWVEESLVEAFSIRGLGRLADSWEQNPPFAGDSAYSASIRDYRADLIKKYGGAGGPISDPGVALWYQSSRQALDKSPLSGIEAPFIVRMVSEMEQNIGCVEDLGALNRWPERSGVRLKDYLTLWQKSCLEVHSPGHLPARIKTLLAVA
jgi:hypothetical protein